MKSALVLLLCSSLTVFAAPADNRDVCVMGGGAGGMYTAMKLKDAGLSVAVFESEDRVGGNCETHFLEDGTAIPVGVILYPDIPIVTDLFDRFGLPYYPFPLDAFDNAAQIDLETGEEVEAFVPTTADVIAAYESLQQLYVQYPYLLGTGNAYPDTFDDDLFLTYGEFQEKYNLKGLWPIYKALASNDPLNSPAWYQLRYLRPVVLSLLAGGTGLILPTHCDSLYNGIASHLGEENVILNADVTKVQRFQSNPNVNVKLTYYDVNDVKHKMNCDKIVVGYRPEEAAMQAFSTDDQEEEVFSALQASNYPTSAFKAYPSSPAAIGLIPPLTWNVKESTDFNVPYPFPTTVIVQFTGYNPLTGEVYLNVQGSSGSPDVDLTNEQVTEMFSNHLNGIPGILAGSAVPLEIKQHRFAALPNNDAVADGFFTKANNLQGHRHTYYVGSTFSFESQFDIFIHAEEVVAQITGLSKKSVANEVPVEKVLEQIYDRAMSISY